MLYKLLRQYLEENFCEEEMKIVFFVEKMLLIHRGEQWSFFGSDGIQWFFPARTIGINGFSMVLLPFDHHH